MRLPVRSSKQRLRFVIVYYVYYRSGNADSETFS